MAKTWLHKWPPSNPPTKQHQAGRIALATLPARLAADTTLLAGMTVGGATINDTPNPCVNWQGGFGHDHSGGWYGRPFVKSVGSQHMRGSHGDSADLDSGFLGSSYYDGDVTSLTIGASSTAKKNFIADVWQWVPNCDPSPDSGAFVVLKGLGMLDFTVGTLEAGDTLTVKIRNVTSGHTVSVSGVTRTTSGNDSFYFNGLYCVPGALNQFVVEYDLTTDATASTRSLYLELKDIEWGPDV